MQDPLSFTFCWEETFDTAPSPLKVTALYVLSFYNGAVSKVSPQQKVKYCCPIKVRKGIPRGLNRRIEAVELSIFDFQAPP